MGPRTKRSDGGHARPLGRVHERRLVNFTAKVKKRVNWSIYVVNWSTYVVHSQGQLVDIYGQLVDVYSPLLRSTGPSRIYRVNWLGPGAGQLVDIYGQLVEIDSVSLRLRRSLVAVVS